MAFLLALLWLTTAGDPAATEPGVLPARALLAITTSQQLLSSQVPANSGWHDIYQQNVQVQPGDVLFLNGQVQMTVDSTAKIGQQFRLTVDGREVGTRSIQINEQQGSHHLPTRALGLYHAKKEATLVIKAQASAFHSDGDFLLKVDHADNLSYGSLIVEHYREFPSAAEAGQAGARLLGEARVAPPTQRQTVAQIPYQQDTISRLELEVQPDDLLRVSGEVLGKANAGLEMMAGVLTAEGKAISPYGGENVLPSNLFAPLRLDGSFRPTQAGTVPLELRVYGGFSQGLSVYQGSDRLQVLHFSSRPEFRHSLRSAVKACGQPWVLPSNAGFVPLLSRELFLRRGDILRLESNVQFGKPEFDGELVVECQLRLAVEGPSQTLEGKTQRNLTGVKVAQPLALGRTWMIPDSGQYTVSLEASGFTETGAVRLPIDPAQSQLYLLHYAAPEVKQNGPAPAPTLTPAP